MTRTPPPRSATEPGGGAFIACIFVALVLLVLGIISFGGYRVWDNTVNKPRDTVTARLCDVTPAGATYMARSHHLVTPDGTFAVSDYWDIEVLSPPLKPSSQLGSGVVAKLNQQLPTMRNPTFTFVVEHHESKPGIRNLMSITFLPETGERDQRPCPR